MTDIPEIARLARQMYADGAATRAIMAETGLRLDRLYYWLKGGPKVQGVPLLPELPLRRPSSRRTRRNVAAVPLRQQRQALAARMMRAAERQVGEIETRLAGTAHAPGDSERDARTLAVLARTMQSLSALDAAHEPATPAKQRKALADDDDYDQIPADIDALRRELTQRLEAMAAGSSE